MVGSFGNPAFFSPGDPPCPCAHLHRLNNVTGTRWNAVVERALNEGLNLGGEGESSEPIDDWNMSAVGSRVTDDETDLARCAARAAEGHPDPCQVEKVARDNWMVCPFPALREPYFGAFESAMCTAAGEGNVNPCARRVGKPGTFLESQDDSGLGNYRAARLQCTPFCFDWVAGTNPGGVPRLIQVVGVEIATNSEYEVQMYGA